jgi:hypothetical protein
MPGIRQLPDWEMMQKKARLSRKGRSKTVGFLVLHAAQRLPALVDRPIRDGYLFKNAHPALRTGLLSVPAGLISLTTNSDPDCAIS